MKISVNFELCESNAVCVKTAPELFRIDEQDMLQFHEGELTTPEQIELAKKAARRCPRRALSVVE